MLPVSTREMSSTSLINSKRYPPDLRCSRSSRARSATQFHLKDLGEPEHRVERRAEFVAHPRHELALGDVRSSASLFASSRARSTSTDSETSREMMTAPVGLPCASRSARPRDSIVTHPPSVWSPRKRNLITSSWRSRAEGVQDQVVVLGMDEIERDAPFGLFARNAKVESLDGLASTMFMFSSMTMIESTAASKSLAISPAGAKASKVRGEGSCRDPSRSRDRSPCERPLHPPVLSS